MLDQRPTARRSVRTLVGALAVATFLQWIGASAVLPLLPLFLRRHGSSDALIGAVMAAYFAGAVAAQYLAGRVGDRIGHRRVLVLGLLGYAAASTGFLADLGGGGDVALRAMQGACAGSAQVAMLALVAAAVPADVRGRAFAAVYGAELAGVAVGPLLGTAVGVAGMGRLFVAAGIAAVLACGPVLASPRVRTPVGAAMDDAQRVRLSLSGPQGGLLAGVLIAAVASGVLTGIYEACWTLLLASRGAQVWQVGTSWTLWALGFVVVAPIAGWLADHHDRRRLVIGAMLASAGLAALYPFITGVGWLIGLGAVESIGVAVATPAAQSLLTDAAPPGASGRTMGLFASVQTASIAVAAAVSGALFGLAPWVPFVSAAVQGAVLTALLARVWRNVAGRVTRS